MALAVMAMMGTFAASGLSEARMRRATARIVRHVEKAGAESPVALGLSANRLGGILATNAVLELEDQGTLAAGKTEIVQFYANVRNLLDEISFADPQIAAAKTADQARGAQPLRASRKTRVLPQIAARVRIKPDTSCNFYSPVQGSGMQSQPPLFPQNPRQNSVWLLHYICGWLTLS